MSVISPLVLLILVYLRVSTEDQAKKGYSIPAQREACQARARELVAELEQTLGRPVKAEIREFVDDYGGDIEERPVLEQVRTILRTERPRYFVCLNPDRFSRDTEIMLRVTKEIRAVGTELEYVEYDFDDSPEGMLQYQVRGAVSEFEKKQILRRTYRGMLRKVQEGGRPNGAAPYGYRHDRLTDKLEIHEPEATWVRRMFMWIAEEQVGATTVANRLNQMGVPTRKGKGRWHRGVVAQILQNTSYIGQMRCQRKNFKGLAAVRRLPREKRPKLGGIMRPQEDWIMVPVPAMIDQALFDQVQQNFQRNKRGGRKDTGLLSMIVRCGKCGGAMGYAYHAYGGYFHIRCPRRYADRLSYKAGTEKCTMRFHRAAAIEEQVWQRILDWLTDPQLLEAYLNARNDSSAVATQISQATGEQTTLKRQLEAKYREQSFTIQSHAQGVLTQAAATAMLATTTEQIRHLESELAGLEERVAHLRERYSSTSRVMDLFGAVRSQVTARRAQLEMLSKEQRRHLVLQLIKHVTVLEDGSIDLEPQS